MGGRNYVKLLANPHLMTLDSLQLLFFKNYDDAALHLSPGLNCFIGDNGSGKTNLLDAIHYLSLTKSAISASDALCIKQGADFFVVKGTFTNDNPANQEVIQVSLRQGQKKTITHDKQPYERMADHIGRYPAVLISPYDTDLIRQGSEERRKYFDSLMAQLDHACHHGLVHGDLFQDSQMELINPAIADVADDHAAIPDQDHGRGGGHPFVSRVRDC